MVGVRGDKGQVAQLLRAPAMFFDNEEDSVALLRDRSLPTQPLDGALVRRGRKRNHSFKFDCPIIRDAGDIILAAYHFVNSVRVGTAARSCSPLTGPNVLC